MGEIFSGILNEKHPNLTATDRQTNKQIKPLSSNIFRSIEYFNEGIKEGTHGKNFHI